MLLARSFPRILLAAVLPGFLAASVSAEPRPGFVRADGPNLVVGTDARPIRLRGANFQNDLLVTPAGEWTREGADDRARTVTDWYREEHVRLVVDLGMNTIRLMLHYRSFEDNARPGRWKEEGWALIDRYVEWARRHRLYLILDLHSPPGGFQSWGGGGALWTSRDHQQRLISLWREIARRYRDEPVIAAYDLLNEPMPYRPDQWKMLAQELVNAVREVDRDHLILVEHVAWVLEGASEWTAELLNTFQFTVDDPRGGGNILYDVHFYEPMAYALQLTPATQNRDGGIYPDPRTQDRTVDGRHLPRTRALLEHELRRRVVDFGRRHGVPMNVGEWAPGDVTFGAKGGLDYVRDLLELFDEHGVHWQYYSINEFHTDGSLGQVKPEPAGTFRNHLRGRKD